MAHIDIFCLFAPNNATVESGEMIGQNVLIQRENIKTINQILKENILHPAR